MSKLASQTPTSQSETTSCYHCGEACADDKIQIDDKSFCCYGCKTVYEILAENDLCNYYALEQSPGSKQKISEWGDRFAFLDNPDIAAHVLRFSSDTLQKVHFYLPSIHCSSCIWLLENLYRLRRGISYSRVNFGRRELSIQFDPREVSLRELAELLASLGYPPEIHLDQLERNSQRKNQKTLYYQIGIAGFCFGNIMLLSFPDYLAVEDWVHEEYKYFFGYLNILLSLPVLFYGGMDYINSAFRALAQRNINLDVPISLGILALFGRSLYEILTLTGAGYLDSLAGLIFFLLVGKWFQSQTYEQLSFDRDYRSYFPLAVQVKDLTTHKTQSKTVRDLKKNELMLIRNQELIPADSILLSEQAYIDYSFVTGETEPLEKIQGDFIYAGGRQIGPSIELAVQKEVEQSYLTQLWNHDAFQKDHEEPANQHIALLSQYFTLGTLLIAFGAALYWYFADSGQMWNAFTAVLIVACPCALALSSPYALGNTMRIFGLNHFYTKSSEVIARLARIDYLVFDKTGTITHADGSTIAWEGELDAAEKAYIGALSRQSTHPLSRKIADFWQEEPACRLDDFEEWQGKGIIGRFDSSWVKMGSASFLGVHPETDNLEDKAQQSRVYVEINGEYRGYFVIQNQYRDAFPDLIKDLGSSYHCALLTGDNASEKQRLKNFFPSRSPILFNQKPEDKLSFVNNKQTEGKNVLMLGDGLNDAGALKQSQVGISLTEDTTSFSPACDAILDASAIGQLSKFLKFSHTTIKIIRLSFILSLLYNLVGVSFAVAGMLTPVLAAILMPLSSVSVVAFVVGLSNWLASREGFKI